MTYTADDLVAAVRRRAQLPDAAADGAFTDADIVGIANEEIALHLVPIVRASREDYWTTSEDVTIVSGTASYRVPWRAQASGLRDVCLVDSAGRERPLARVSPTELGRIQSYGGSIDTTVFVMEGPAVRLVPTPTVSGYTLRMRYHRAHPTLVPNASSGIVGSLSGDILALSQATTGLNGETLTPVPATWAAGYSIDVFHRVSPFGPVALDIYIESIDDTNPLYDVYTVTGGAPAAILGNVYYMASIPGQTSIVDLPRECWPLLVSAVSARVLEEIGDRDAAQMAIALYQREKDNVASLLEPRVEGAKMKVVDRNSPLRRGGRRWP